MSRSELKNRPRPSRVFLIALALAICAAASCSARKESVEAPAFTDELGRAVKLARRPERIVSLAPSVTETLFALGQGDRVIAVTTYCDYPPEAGAKERVGDTLKPNLERIVALRPDLVIASTASQLEQFVRTLDEVGIPVYVSNPRDIGGVFDSINRIGEITGASDRARELTAGLNGRVESLRERVKGQPPPAVLFLLSAEPLITVGGKSFINDLITRAGGRSVSAGETAEYPQYSLETAVASQPEVIFLQTGGSMALPARLSQTPAARAGRVFTLDDNLLLRPGPRVVDGLELMAMRIHPEVLKALQQ